MTDTVLRLDGVMVARESRPILEGLTFSVRRGELVALMGASGTGKTTVLRAVAGLEPFGEGEIDVDGVRLRPKTLLRGSVLRDLYLRVGMVFQFHNLFSNLTAVHNVWLAPVHVQRVSRAEAETKAFQLLQSLGVGHRARAFPHELSGGEAQRVAIARALAVDPPLLLMDEPTASLDVARRQELADTLRSLVGAGRALMVATHDAEFARTCAHRVLLLEQGRVVRAGTVSEMLG
jgi:ABC-type polar amino acid transport system ATPase subunit